MRRHRKRTSDLPTFTDVVIAAERIRPFVHHTPVLTSHTLDDICHAKVYLKCENLQKVGAFKARGACNAILGMKDVRRGVATHSSGNHGASVAYAAGMRNTRAYIVVPEGSSPVKLASIKNYGGEIVTCRPGMTGRKEKLDEVVAETGALVVHPYDDPMVIAGQGTAALELLSDVPEIDTIVTPVGGGGLISGSLLVAKQPGRSIRVVGAEPEAADDARQSLSAGRRIVLDAPRTIADGLRAPIGERNFEIIRRYVDGIVSVTEEEIVSAMRFVWERMKILIEPSSAVPVAALLGGKVNVSGLTVGLIITGGNVDLDNLPW